MVSPISGRTDVLTAEAITVLVVDAAGQRCGLPVGAVEEVHRMVRITPLTGAPVTVEGLVNVHGEPLPVVDLAHRLGLPSRRPRQDDRLVVARAGRRVALRVEAAHDVVVVPTAAVRPARDVAPGARLLAGVVPTHDGLLLVHDLAALLSSNEADALDRALAGQGAGR